MKKITATIIKEWILLRRDVAGFMLLFLMPAILIVVMAMVQDAPFKDYQEIKFDLLLADNDHGKLSEQIISGLRQSKNFRIIDSIDGKPVNDSTLKHLLQKGTYKVGIVIPKGATAEVVNAANTVSNKISEKLGLGKLPAREIRTNTYVRMYFDPVSKPTFRMSISFALDKYVTASCSNLLVARMQKLGAANVDSTIEEQSTDDFKKVFSGIGIKEEPLNDKAQTIATINSVQHNVPAWAIFGMFLIVIPIAGNMIREREEGSALRIELIPGTHNFVALGKIFFYTIICTIQFVLMCCIGFWMLPMMGLPSLSLGAHPAALIPVIICIALTATSFGYFTGSIFKTANQALPFGAISVVVLSALGGIWIPADLLPETIQHLALISPLRWGLDGVNQIILRNGDISQIMMHVVVMLGFSFLLWLISTYVNRGRNFSVQ
ncbi:MAG: ABC transporter permease [Bacteroidetes bacterium]|nr:ABC transporter permease [Bacteroidota bacterium]